MSTLAYDGTAMLGRHLRRIRHNPGLLILTQSMPITMLLFFGYVFGSALATPGQGYRAFLLPGLLVATAANGIMTGMFQAAQDSHRGVMDRFRTLPMSRAAVPLGQALAGPRGHRRGHGAADAGRAGRGLADRGVGAPGGGRRRTPAALPVRDDMDRHRAGPRLTERGGGRSTGRRDVHPAAAVETRTSPPTTCPAGCARWPSGIRSAR